MKPARPVTRSTRARRRRLSLAPSIPSTPLSPRIGEARRESFAFRRSAVTDSCACVTSVAMAGTTRSSTSSKVSPRRDKKKPYKLTTTGSVALPPSYCQPNAPGPACIPPVCPPGASILIYCMSPSRAQIRGGRIRVVFKQGRRTRSARTVRLQPTCRYSSTAIISSKGRLKVSVSFQGNSILAPSKASTKSVRAG